MSSGDQGCGVVMFEANILSIVVLQQRYFYHGGGLSGGADSPDSRVASCSSLANVPMILCSPWSWG